MIIRHFQKLSCFRIIVLIGCFFSAIAVGVSAQSFEEFKERQAQEAQEYDSGAEIFAFEEYKRSVEEGFNQYKQIVEQAFQEYQQQILEKWEDSQVSTKTRWVAYSDDYETRQIVDFEKGFIQLDMILDKEKSADAIDMAVKRQFSDLVIVDQKTAVERDQLIQRIENEMQEQSLVSEAPTIDERPVLTRVFTETDDPSEEQVKAVVNQLKEDAVVTDRPSKIENKKTVSVQVRLPPDSLRIKADELKPSVDNYAQERNLNASLVLSIIHTESSFNPMARSHIPAYGLMQIVPESAGKDASALMYGEPRLLSPSFLYDSDQNINVGTSYFHILFTRYLRNIDNHESRMYCAIAAYNTGSGNVAKAFVGTMNIGRAVQKINQMTPEQVYEHLIRNLPYDETKNYLKKVMDRMELYAAYD